MKINESHNNMTMNGLVHIFIANKAKIKTSDTFQRVDQDYKLVLKGVPVLLIWNRST